MNAPRGDTDQSTTDSTYWLLNASMRPVDTGQGNSVQRCECTRARTVAPQSPGIPLPTASFLVRYITSLARMQRSQDLVWLQMGSV